MSPQPPGSRGRGRGQAFTLEGFIASIVVLTAVLFALQSVVITPTTSGAVDQSVETQIQTQARDILVASASREGIGPLDDPTGAGYNRPRNLTSLVLFWNGTLPAREDTFAFARGTRTIGYGPDPVAARPEPGGSSNDRFEGEPWCSAGNENNFCGPPVENRAFYGIGERLNDTFTQRGRVFNLIVEYQTRTPGETRTIPIVFRGVPSDTAVETSVTVALYDYMTLTGPGDQSVEWGTAVDDDDMSREPDTGWCNEVPVEAISSDLSVREIDGGGPESRYFAENSTFSSGAVDPNCYYPIPDAYDGGGSASGSFYQRNDPVLYNVVEIRLVVW